MDKFSKNRTGASRIKANAARSKFWIPTPHSKTGTSKTFHLPPLSNSSLLLPVNPYSLTLLYLIVLLTSMKEHQISSLWAMNPQMSS
uniref:Uncharacterized protein n=1 Tax=Lepeophtheirus salmonis TaxID=72036 RepID=A0A0K2TYA9_LEPSM